MGKVIMSGIVPQLNVPVAYDPVFANNDWVTIIKVCQAGICPKTWEVGDKKAITIEGKEYLVDIIGKNHDMYSDGSGKAPLTFQLHDCYGTTYWINSSNTNVGGWTSCAMRTTHLQTVFALMPSEVQSGIKKVNKFTGAGGASSTINTTEDKLFLLSEIEVFGTATYSVAGEGAQYDYYAAGNGTGKYLNGTGQSSWTRSPFGNATSGWIAARGGTGVDSISIAANSSSGIAFAFCF